MFDDKIWYTLWGVFPIKSLRDLIRSHLIKYFYAHNEIQTLLVDLHRPIRATLLRDLPYPNLQVNNLVPNPWYALKDDIWFPPCCITNIILIY